MLCRSHGAPLRYQVTLEPHGQRWLFALEMPAAAPQLERQSGAASATTANCWRRAPISQRVRYDAVSYVDFELEPAEPRAPAASLAAIAARPQSAHARIRPAPARASPAMMPSWCRRCCTISAAKPFRYTLNPPLLGGDGVDEFLFSTRAGFCEHYAGAFVVLMRAMDIPARVVTGYQGGELNPVDGY